MSKLQPLLIFCIALLCLQIFGCGVKYRGEIELVNAEFITPEENIPMEIRAKRLGPDRISSSLKDDFLIETRTGDYFIRFSGYPEYKDFLIQYMDEKEIIFLEDKTSYQLNNKPPVNIEFVVYSGEIVDGLHKTYYYQLGYKLPEPLSTYNTRIIGGSISKSVAQRIKKRDGDIHRFYFPFTVDGEPYAVDVSFRLKVDTLYFQMDGPA